MRQLELYTGMSIVQAINADWIGGWPTFIWVTRGIVSPLNLIDSFFQKLGVACSLNNDR